MSRPFKNKNLRATLENQLSDLAEQAEDLRQQLADRAPVVRDQIVGQTGEVRQQLADRAPAVRDQIIAALPDKSQLLHLRDDVFDRLPETVQEKLPERVKPKRSKLRKVAAVGLLTGAGAAAFAILKRQGAAPRPAPTAYVPPTSPVPPAAQAAQPPTGGPRKS